MIEEDDSQYNSRALFMSFKQWSSVAQTSKYNSGFGCAGTSCLFSALLFVYNQRITKRLVHEPKSSKNYLKALRRCVGVTGHRGQQ